MIYWTTKEHDTQVPIKAEHLTHAQNTSKLLTCSRHIKHIQTEQAPTISYSLTGTDKKN